MTNTETMIKALLVLSEDIQSGDGVANACVADAANMIENMSTQLAKANEEYKNLFEIFESCQARMLRYKSAIDEECVLWDFTVDEKEPRKSIQRLLDITDAVARDPDVNSKARKFAIENQIKGAKALIYAFPLNACDQMKEWVEQLRKEQER